MPPTPPHHHRGDVSAGRRHRPAGPPYRRQPAGATGPAVVVENRPGASGNIGARAVAPPDGYTLLMVNSSFAINPGVYRNLGFDPRRDFAAVINVAFVPSVFVTPAASALRNLDDALEAAQPASRCRSRPAATARRSIWPARCWRARPARPCSRCRTGLWPGLDRCDGGAGAAGHRHRVQRCAVDRGGQAAGAGGDSPKRSPLLPQVATVAEQGVKDYALDQWHGLLAPAATPPAVIDRINVAVARIMQRRTCRWLCANRDSRPPPARQPPSSP